MVFESLIKSLIVGCGVIVVFVAMRMGLSLLTDILTTIMKLRLLRSICKDIAVEARAQIQRSLQGKEEIVSIVKDSGREKTQ